MSEKKVFSKICTVRCKLKMTFFNLDKFDWIMV